jgi:hypothetical protein
MEKRGGASHDAPPRSALCAAAQLSVVTCDPREFVSQCAQCRHRGWRESTRRRDRAGVRAQRFHIAPGDPEIRPVVFTLIICVAAETIFQRREFDQCAACCFAAGDFAAGTFARGAMSAKRACRITERTDARAQDVQPRGRSQRPKRRIRNTLPSSDQTRRQGTRASHPTSQPSAAPSPVPPSGRTAHDRSVLRSIPMRTAGPHSAPRHR